MAQQIVEEAIASQDSLTEIKGLDLIALIFQRVGLQAESLSYTYRALRTAEAIDSEPHIRALRSNLAKLHFELQAYKECLNTIRKSKRLSYGQVDSVYWGHLQLLEGLTLLAMDDVSNATRLLSQDFTPFLRHYPVFEHTYYYQLGLLYQKQNKLDSAKLFFEKSLTASEGYEQHASRVYSKLHLAEVLEQLNRPNAAETLLQTAQEEASYTKSALLKHVSRALAGFYARQEEKDKAYEVYRLVGPQIDSMEAAEQALHRAILKARSEHQTTHVLKKRLKAQQERSEALNRNQWLYLIGIILITLIGILYWLWQGARSSRRKRLAELLQREVERSEQHNRELKTLNEQLESLNGLKNKLLSIVGHELRNPISNLQGVLELMDSGDLSKEEEQDLRQSLSEELSGTALLLENLLRWSKNQLKGITFNPKAVEMVKLVKYNVDILQWQAERKSIQVHCEVPAGVFGYVDVEMINIVLKNLLTNAFKFTPEGGRVRIRLEEKGEEALRLKVIDTGRGISEEEQQNLFTLQSKSRPGTQAEPGTGLGLLLCREFVERNGGSIWVESELGKGSTFTFDIPRIDAPSLVEQ